MWKETEMKWNEDALMGTQKWKDERNQKEMEEPEKKKSIQFRVPSAEEMLK